MGFPMTNIRTKLSSFLAITVILVVLANSIPNGLGIGSLDIPQEFLKALAFFGLFSAIILRQPFANLTDNKALASGLEALTFITIAGFTYTYLNELLIEKPDLFPLAWQEDIDPMSRLLEGVPLWVGVTAVVTALVLIGLNWILWGAGIAIIALVCSAYVLVAVFGTQYEWFEGNKFLTYNAAVHDPLGEIHKWLIVGDDHSLLGRFPTILLSIVIPFVVLGTLFARTGGGQSLIKLAFVLTRNLRGGPGHAAVMSSSVFGTMSGGPVVNVLATGTLTIPMMLKRRFSPTFAGGVESAASSGGQIVPPVMGVAAFFLADFTGVPYNKVILAALIPALFYYITLFTSVAIEARKLQLQPIGDDLPEDLIMQRQDYLNLWIVGVPIGIIIVVLVSGAYSVTAAGIFSIVGLLAVSFIDPNIRKSPLLLVEAFSAAGLQAGRILLLFMAVAVVAASLSATGFTNSFGTLISQIVEASLSFNLFGQDIQLPHQVSFLIVLAVTMLLSLILGMGMPTLPAYVNVTIVMAAVMSNIGISLFTANMFVFYFAVASAITPPVAIASFAAASITQADPLKTGLMSLRLGIAMFIVPFVFAVYPELLLIEEAFIIDLASGATLENRPHGFDWAIFFSIVPRLFLSIILLTTAFSRFDSQVVSNRDAYLRLLLVIPCLLTSPSIYIPACALAILLIVRNRVKKP